MITWLIEDLPLFIVMFFVMFFFLDVFIPNQRQFGKYIGVIIFELFEHLVLPAYYIVISVLLPFEYISVALLIGIILFVYILVGLVIGRARSMQDWLRVSWLFLIFYFMIYLYPSVLDYSQQVLSIPGYLTLSATIIIAYLIAKKLRRNLNESLYDN
jgi:uncharacterized protein YneF (UPF0154 family)